LTGEHHHHQAVPPSAAGQLEPYGIRVMLRSGPAELDAEPFLVALLESLAAGCTAAGATVIGHLKCLLHLPDGTLACNLTSLNGGARCSARGTAQASRLPAGAEGRLDLAVLVYGLSADGIDGLARAALARLLDPTPVRWSVTTGACEKSPQ
jgi:hypothetical protein